MQASGHLDWLAVTYQTCASYLELLPDPARGFPLELQGAGVHGYRSRLVNKLGCVVMADGLPGQGVHVIFTGEPLQELRLLGVNDHALALLVKAHGGKVSRLDVALDLIGGTMTRDDLVTAFLAGEVVTRARSGKLWKDLITPEGTFYVGSAASNKLFRAYDKGAQVKSEVSWLRLELQTRRLHAQAITEALQGSENTRAVINRAVDDFIDFPGQAEFRQAVSGAEVEIPIVHRKLTNTLRWLIEQVAPAVVKYQRQHPDEDVQAILNAAIEQEKRHMSDNR